MNIKIGKFFGIPLYLNIFTVIIALFILAFAGPFVSIVYNFALFFVVLHEYGHCFAALKCNMKAQDVYILPIGGVANITFECHDPKKEIIVALAGPLVNVLLIVIISPFLLLNNQAPTIFILINCMILAYNLLPIHPLDGGRVLRATLSLFLDYASATWWAVRIGQTLGVFVILTAIHFGFYMMALVTGVICFFSQYEIAEAYFMQSIINLKKKLALDLNKPELANAKFSEIVTILETIDDEKVKQDLKVDDLLVIFKSLA